MTSLQPDRLAWLVARGADRIAHLSGNLLEHLQRTARRLEAWGADPVLVAAGLCHAAYGTQGFPTALLRLDERAALRELLGHEAEAIVYAYCACDRAHALAGSCELRDRFNGQHWLPSGRMSRQLAELTAANELDVVEHAPCDAAQLAGIGALIGRGAAHLSQAAWAAFRASACAPGRDAARGPAGDPELSYLELGTDGARVVLWHGGGSPELTWSRQHSLATQFQLRIPWRRGFAPSAPSSAQDWEPDTRDLLRLMPGCCHVVAHSYGAVSATVAACSAPERFQSLVLIEPPLSWVAPESEEVQQLVALARAYARGAPEARGAFLQLAALPLQHPETVRTEQLARNFRDPDEAEPALDTLRRAGMAVAVVSGDHARGVEILCDALAERLGARRWRIAGSGHAVQRCPAFNEHLANFIAAPHQGLQFEGRKDVT